MRIWVFVLRAAKVTLFPFNLYRDSFSSRRVEVRLLRWRNFILLRSVCETCSLYRAILWRFPPLHTVSVDVCFALFSLSCGCEQWKKNPLYLLFTPTIPPRRNIEYSERVHSVYVIQTADVPPGGTEVMNKRIICSELIFHGHSRTATKKKQNKIRVFRICITDVSTDALKKAWMCPIFQFLEHNSSKKHFREKCFKQKIFYVLFSIKKASCVFSLSRIHIPLWRPKVYAVSV